MKIRYCLLFLSVILISVYLLLFFSTSSIVNEVEKVMVGDVPKELTQNLPVDMYNRSNDTETVSADADIKRVFVLHNFFDGYMWVVYSCEGFDGQNNRTHGSWNVLSRWKIHKENGEWNIVDIKEKP